ncbi:hypothetical protein C0J52_09725 [Blattella germanica]|nr:hypothetical protein C0J52_09725 [Blattella germanica]
MPHEFKPLFNVVLQNQLVVPVWSYNFLQQQFDVFETFSNDTVQVIVSKGPDDLALLS